MMRKLTEHTILKFPHLHSIQKYCSECSVLFSDVVTIEKTGENFRLIYDTKGRFTVHRISPEEASVSANMAVWSVLV